MHCNETDRLLTRAIDFITTYIELLWNGLQKRSVTQLLYKTALSYLYADVISNLRVNDSMVVQFSNSCRVPSDNIRLVLNANVGSIIVNKSSTECPIKYLLKRRFVFYPKMSSMHCNGSMDLAQNHHLLNQLVKTLTHCILHYMISHKNGYYFT